MLTTSSFKSLLFFRECKGNSLDNQPFLLLPVNSGYSARLSGLRLYISDGERTNLKLNLPNFLDSRTWNA